MNRSAIKKYAPQARKDFIEAVTARAMSHGLSKSGKHAPIKEEGDVAIIDGKAFPRIVAAQRRRLEQRIRQDGFDRVMDAMAYTWFNRLVAIRFMELHGYLDHGYRVLSHPDGKAQPEILENAERVELKGLDTQTVIDLKLAGDKDDELYRRLLLAQCEALHQAMPFLFPRIDEETELLLPDNLLHSDSLIRRLVAAIPEEDWQEVEIIGWIYQFYISERKDQVIGKTVKSEDIPAATQLFTPNWIVQYLVQNSLGRQWMATYPDSGLTDKMPYYIQPAEQTPEVQAQLDAATPDSLDPEALTLLDPACGSGHILVEAYRLFKAIYLERGYRLRDIPRLILTRNLYGLEIDDRAAQLAGFALMMVARPDDRRLFQRGIQLNVLALQEPKDLDPQQLADAFAKAGCSAADGLTKPPPKPGEFDFTVDLDNPLFASADSDTPATDPAQAKKLKPLIARLLGLFEHAKTFGSLIRVPDDISAQLPVLAKVVQQAQASDNLEVHSAGSALARFIVQAQLLSSTCDAVVANPPYMGTKGMSGQVKAYLGDSYEDVKSDLFAAFIVRNTELAKRNGQLGFMSPFVWMFISSYEKLRDYLIGEKTITSLVQLEYSGFEGATVPICTFTLANYSVPEFKGGYIRLSDFRGAFNQGPKTLEAIQNQDCGWFYHASAADFKKIPGSPIAYWVNPKLLPAFAGKTADDFCDVKKGMATGNNSRFLRLWYEVSHDNIGFSAVSSEDTYQKRWYPCLHGGEYRKWISNYEYVVDWQEDGKHPKSAITSRTGDHWSRYIISTSYFFREGINWTAISSSSISARFHSGGFAFTSASMAAFSDDSIKAKGLMLLINSSVGNYILSLLSPTLNYGIAEVKQLPYIEDSLAQSSQLADELVKVSEQDWNSKEYSWNFLNIPLLKSREESAETSYCDLREAGVRQTERIAFLEEENNRNLANAYGLSHDLSIAPAIEQITLTCNPAYRYGPGKTEEEYEELQRADTAKELLSYALGCMMGRYSLDEPGLIYAHAGNEGFDPSRYPSFPADDDGIIPVTEEPWFEDDFTHRFERFIEVCWPDSPLQENLDWVADSLDYGRKKDTTRETIRRYMAMRFYQDHHLSVYKRRPIYWLFSSGRQRAFQCFVYLHRYNEQTLARIRTAYVIPLQGKINARIDQLDGDIDKADSTTQRRKLEKERDNLKKQRDELIEWDGHLRKFADKRITLDLDDGVKVNYGKFGPNLLAEVKAIATEIEEA